jgi:hypothetical protein
VQVIDGQNGAFVKENLVQLSRKIHQFIPNGVTFNQLGVMIDNTGGYANAIKSLRLSYDGDFEKSGTSTTTNGKIRVGGDTNLIPVDGYEAESDYSVTELNQARIENRNLQGELFKAHQDKYLRKLDTLIYDKLIGYTGFTKEDSPKTWASMTDEELSDTLRNLVIKQRNAVSMGYEADVLVMPKDLKLRCESSDYKALGEMSIAEKLAKTLGVRLVGTTKLKGVGTGGTDLVIAISSNEDSMVIRVPKRLSISPVSRFGNKFYFEGSFRVAGLDILEDGAGYILDKM